MFVYAGRKSKLRAQRLVRGRFPAESGNLNVLLIGHNIRFPRSS